MLFPRFRIILTPETADVDELSVILLPRVQLEDIKILEDSETTRKARDLALATLKDRDTLLRFGAEGDSGAKRQAVDRSELIAKLERHQLPVKVTENDDLSVLDGLVTIGYPYNSSTCSSTNAIVLNRVKDLLDEGSNNDDVA